MSELYFSLVTRGDDNAKTSEVTVSERLTIEWDKAYRRFKANDGSGLFGWGKTEHEAALEYLSKRLGIRQPAMATFSRRIH